MSQPSPSILTNYQKQCPTLLFEFAENKEESFTVTGLEDFLLGINDPCPCGSGKKYKKCWGGN